MQRSRGCTLAQYAEAKKLPVEFLQSLGLSEIPYLGTKVVRLPYVDVDGNEPGVRFRIAASGEDKFRWRKGSKVILYGLPRLSQAREVGYVILVEGESCAQTAWFHGYPAIGLPGAANWRDDRDAPHLADIPTIYVVIEPDRGGEAILDWLGDSEIKARVRLVRLPGAKDVSELYLAQPDRFVERLEVALQSATPWDEHDRIHREMRSRQAWKECATLAREPRILDHLQLDLRRAGLAGEERVASIVYLAMTSRVLKKIVSIAVKGPSSGGKSFVVDRVMGFFPERACYALTAMSERALAYGTEPLSHRHLVLYEAAGLESEFAGYLVRSLLSEGRVRYETVEKGPNGLEPRLIEREGPTGLIITTTAVSLHPENETRLLSLTVNDTPEQTKRVLIAISEDEEALDLGPWQALQEWLAGDETSVTVPYARALAELIPPIAVRLRRDFSQILMLIRAHTLLHRATRDRDDHGQVIATLEDYRVVRDLVSELIAEGIDATVPENVRETVQAVARLNRGDGVSLTALAKDLGLDKSATSRRWRAARDRGYLLNLQKTKGRPARIVPDEPLPADVEVLPDPALLDDRCTVATVQEGEAPPSSPGDEGART